MKKYEYDKDAVQEDSKDEIYRVLISIQNILVEMNKNKGKKENSDNIMENLF